MQKGTGKKALSAKAAIDFLEQLRPGGPWLLVAIDPNRDRDKITAFTAQQPAEASSFIERWNGKHNLYYTVNPIRKPLNKKAKKTDIAAIEYLLVDLDPAKDETPAEAKGRYLAQLKAMQPIPTAVIDSGNGLNALWRLAQSIPLPAPVNGKYSPETQAVIADVEARCKAIMQRLGSVPGTQNIDRILRLPGTVNLPTKAKRAAGRVPCETALLWFDGPSCALDDFPLKPKPKAKPTGGDEAKLPLELRAMLHLPDNGAGNRVGDWPTRSHLFWAFINAALRKGVDENKIVEATLDSAYAGNAIHAHVEENGGEDHVKRQIERAANELPVDEKGRTVIRVVSGKIDETWRAVQDALIAHNCPVYVRGKKLVQPLFRWEKASDDESREVLTADFERLNIDRLADITGHHAVQFQKYDKRERQWNDIDPPDKVMKRLIEIKHWLFKTVVGIINAPTMRRDGSLLTEEWYDERTQLWYKSSGEIHLPHIPERPSREQAETALATLNGLLKDFPFEGEGEKSEGKSVARSVALAGMMTTALRGALRVAVPIFLINAPEARTGKTYLVNLIAVLATGHIPPSTAGASEDRPDEIEKRIETAGLSGRPIMHLNNLPNGMVLDSARLSELCTEGHVTIRMLGRHEEGLCDCRATTVFLNGNNVQVAGDLVPRTLPCRLDARLEEPETRTFDFDPIAAVREDRGKYLGAIFTIVRAFMAAKCPRPPDMHSVAGFEAWSQFVQQPLMWLGMADPYGNITRMRAADHTLDELRTLLKVLSEVFNAGDTFTVAKCRTLSNQHQNLRELMNFKGQLDTKAFGRLLGRYQGRTRDGWSYQATDTLSDGYIVYKLEGPSGEKRM